MHRETVLIASKLIFCKLKMRYVNTLHTMVVFLYYCLGLWRIVKVVWHTKLLLRNRHLMRIMLCGKDYL
jgi:hypothetical protein